MIRIAGKTFTAERQIARRDGHVLDKDEIGIEAPSAKVVADLGPILAAIRTLEGKVDRVVGTEHLEIERIRTTKAEIAALRHPLAQDDKLLHASAQLEAVVASTENATNRIMSAAEYIDEAITELKSHASDSYQAARLNDIADQVIRIFESRNFQDLTGQRITKVVKTLAFVEDRVTSMMKI